jgi:hypothetical protein
MISARDLYCGEGNVELVVLSRFVGDLRYRGASILIISPSVYLLCHLVSQESIPRK